MNHGAKFNPFRVGFIHVIFSTEIEALQASTYNNSEGVEFRQKK